MADSEQDRNRQEHTGHQRPARGQDERRTSVDPASSPAPSSPEPDEEAVRKGEENLDRVVPS